MDNKSETHEDIKEFHRLVNAGKHSITTDDILAYFDIDAHRKNKVILPPPVIVQVFDMNAFGFNEGEFKTLNLLVLDLKQAMVEYIQTYSVLARQLIDGDPELRDAIESAESYSCFMGDDSVLYVKIKQHERKEPETNGEVLVRIKKTLMRLVEQDNNKEAKIDSIIKTLSHEELDDLRTRLDGL